MANHTHTWWYNMSPLIFNIKNNYVFIVIQFFFIKSFLQNFTNLFGQPLVCLMSPTSYPKTVQGEILTLFHCFPLLDQSLSCLKIICKKLVVECCWFWLYVAMALPCFRSDPTRQSLHAVPLLPPVGLLLRVWPEQRAAWPMGAGSGVPPQGLPWHRSGDNAVEDNGYVLLVSAFPKSSHLKCTPQESDISSHYCPCLANCSKWTAARWSIRWVEAKTVRNKCIIIHNCSCKQTMGMASVDYHHKEHKIYSLISPERTDIFAIIGAQTSLSSFFLLKLSRAPFPDNDGSTLVRSFSQRIFRTFQSVSRNSS